MKAMKFLAALLPALVAGSGRSNLRQGQQSLDAHHVDVSIPKNWDAQVVTFNVNEVGANQITRAHMSFTGITATAAPTFVIISLQEVKGSHKARAMLATINTIVPINRYKKVSSKFAGSIVGHGYSGIAVYTPIATVFSHVEKNSYQCGLGLNAEKSVAGVKWQFGDDIICALGGHYPAGDDHAGRLTCLNGALTFFMGPGGICEGATHTFLTGDFNFRTAPQRNNEDSRAQSLLRIGLRNQQQENVIVNAFKDLTAEEKINMGGDDGLTLLLAQDELTGSTPWMGGDNQLTRLNAASWKNGAMGDFHDTLRNAGANIPTEFPSYSVQKNRPLAYSTSEWKLRGWPPYRRMDSKDRPPSWTDRVLYSVRTGVQTDMEADRLHVKIDVQLSDHKPAYCHFDVTHPPPPPPPPPQQLAL